MDCHVIRLVGGTNSSYGRLEMGLGIAWGSVCDLGFGHAEAVVACRQLGFVTGEPIKTNAIPNGVGPITAANVSCEGFGESPLPFVA